MENSLRRWKCRDCSRANETAIEIDGTAQCVYCSRRTSVQPSRLKNGVVLPASYPTRMGSPNRTTHVRSLGEV
jgi:DNA-directed RNA polymerase subunit RPC12/RpoP